MSFSSRERNTTTGASFSNSDYPIDGTTFKPFSKPIKIASQLMPIDSFTILDVVRIMASVKSYIMQPQTPDDNDDKRSLKFDSENNFSIIYALSFFLALTAISIVAHAFDVFWKRFRKSLVGKIIRKLFAVLKLLFSLVQLSFLTLKYCILAIFLVISVLNALLAVLCVFTLVLYLLFYFFPLF
ncbi:hypothetical protein C8Q75DRAFT_768298 [Abortiporus biennis]|nr:hypothetical protein C8Q75DRAFT_768298 [Abortiporus biennis]